MTDIETRKKLITQLLQRIMTVTFDKVNGEERVMNCTLMDEYLPEPINEETVDVEFTEAEAVAEKTSLAVWDVDAKGWRSFRWDNVKAFERIADDKGY